jgi:predicted CxxxxCH...CXXCH cytochrome family protein
MRTRSVVLVGLAFLAATGMLWRCSSPNSNAPTLDESGKHPANWILYHRPAFLADRGRCTGCHGSDLRGGISTVSCFSPQFNGQSCHADGPKGHPVGWRDPALHGADAKSQPGPDSGFQSCQLCHGSDYSGFVTGVSCFTANRPTGPCHVTNGVPVGSPHAPIPWKTYPAPTHTDTVDDDAGSNAAVCALCHTAGANLRHPIITSYSSGKPGCFNSTLCHGQMGHPVGWARPDSHGLAARSNLTWCQQCHADNPSGGPGSNPRFNVQLGRLNDTALGNTGCEVCHAPLAAHPRVLRIPAAFGAIATQNPLGTPWYLHCKANPSGFDACGRCHGANLDGVGGVAGASACALCHRIGLPTTLKNCTSCHASPPGGNSYPDTALAHAAHAGLNTTDVCGACHNGIGSITLDHFSRARNRTTQIQPGAVQFGAFARTNGVSPVFDEATLKCTNTYCHGATLAGGANKSPLWSATNYLTASGCGTCHGFPPPNTIHAGFTSGTVCKSCHPHVNASNTGFDDPTKHVNGVLDIAGVPHGFPNPGSVHASAAGTAPFPGCVTNSCHTNGSAIGVYPVPTGTPPDCRACHIKAGPGNSCGSCHGTAATSGRPNGSAFPDVAGHHSVHAGFACSLCHGTSGTGNVNHGPDNRVAHGDANVVIQFTGEAAAMAYTRSGLNNGSGTCTGFCHELHSGRTW